MSESIKEYLDEGKKILSDFNGRVDNSILDNEASIQACIKDFAETLRLIDDLGDMYAFF